MKKIRSTGIRLLLIGTIAAVAVVLTGGGTALAAPPSPATYAVASTPIIDAAGQLVVPDMAAPGTTIILSEKATKAIIAAIVYGTGAGALAACQAAVPAAIKDYCPYIVGLIAASVGPFATAPSGKCLKIAIKLGKPPVAISLVPCPGGQADDPGINTSTSPPGKITIGPGGTAVWQP